MNNQISELTVVVDKLLTSTNVLLELGKDTPKEVVSSMLNHIYRLTYELTSAQVNKIKVISVNSRTEILKFINSNMYLRKEETTLSEIEYKIYQILRVMKELDRESYNVIIRII